MAEPRLIPIGRIVGVFGVKGWVKVFSDTDPPDNILRYTPWYIQKHGQWIPTAVVDIKIHGKGFIAQLEGCTDRDQAMGLIGSDIAVNRTQLPPLAPGEHYWVDLEGFEVVNQQQFLLGTVNHFFATGANDVMVVKAADGKERWIPYIANHYVLHVDDHARRITVDWDSED